MMLARIALFFAILLSACNDGPPPQSPDSQHSTEHPKKGFD